MRPAYNIQVQWAEEGIKCYSGVAWATTEEFENDHINIITTWPGKGPEEGKAPTELYSEDETMMWGYDIPDDADPIRWFKLLLLKDEDLGPELCASEFILRGKRMLRDSGKTAIALVADFLRALFNHTMYTITKARGKEVVDAMRLHIVITVPAIWKGYARQAMETAAEQAGILYSRAAGETKLTLAPEPEAAALSTLSEPGRKVGKNDVYIICDAGGGTVDLISYQIDQTKPISMQEAVEGTGSLCGGIFIDEAFERACKARLGSRWNHLSDTGKKRIMKNEWEALIKPTFVPNLTHREYIVEIPAEAFSESNLNDFCKEPIIKNGRIHFKEAFIDSFEGIDELVARQIRMATRSGLTITGIILVGGLGASPYLYDHLKEQHGMKVLQSGGIQPTKVPTIQVTSTVSRSSYGVTYRAEFDREKHLQEDKEYDVYLGGEIVSQKEPVRFTYYEIYKEDVGGHFSVGICECDAAEVPDRRTFQVNDFCYIDCKLDAPFSSLPDIMTIDGTMAKKMTYVVEMIPSGASVEFTVYIDGRKQGSHNACVRFE
ncbi:hypothetical protein CSPX01_02183 [Colletotrichum filicis]|nr:hypothetical protein CSPX01_02183 [Colletotrichum filicis]